MQYDWPAVFLSLDHLTDRDSLLGVGAPALTRGEFSKSLAEQTSTFPVFPWALGSDVSVSQDYLFSLLLEPLLCRNWPVADPGFPS